MASSAVSRYSCVSDSPWTSFHCNHQSFAEMVWEAWEQLSALKHSLVCFCEHACLQRQVCSTLQRASIRSSSLSPINRCNPCAQLSLMRCPVRRFGQNAGPKILECECFCLLFLWEKHLMGRGLTVTWCYIAGCYVIIPASQTFLCQALEHDQHVANSIVFGNWPFESPFVIEETTRIERNNNYF